MVVVGHKLNVQFHILAMLVRHCFVEVGGDAEGMFPDVPVCDSRAIPPSNVSTETPAICLLAMYREWSSHAIVVNYDC